MKRRAGKTTQSKQASAVSVEKLDPLPLFFVMFIFVSLFRGSSCGDIVRCFQKEGFLFLSGTAFEKMICEKIVRQTKKISVPFRCYFGIFITFVEPAGAYARPIVTVGILRICGRYTACTSYVW